MVAIKLAAVVFFIFAGFTFVKPENWSPFMPYGFSGVMAAAAVVFFGYIGSMRSRPRLKKRSTRNAICRSDHRVARDLHAALLDRIGGVDRYLASARVQDQCSVPERAGGLRACRHSTRIGRPVSSRPAPSAASPACSLVMLMSQPRIFFAMSRDRLLPAGASKVHPSSRRRT
jgi:APA family basic amino acid/polyamine antiporter